MFRLACLRWCTWQEAIRGVTELIPQPVFYLLQLKIECSGLEDNLGQGSSSGTNRARARLSDNVSLQKKHVWKQEEICLVRESSLWKSLQHSVIAWLDPPVWIIECCCV